MLKTLMPSLNQLITADYKSIKTPETEALISRFLKGLTPVPNPELRQISGIPGSGKSTYCAKYLPANFLLLSFDEIMTELPAYQREAKLFGVKSAYAKYEMPARIMGYELLRRAIKSRLNIMFEHSGTNNAHIELFKNLSKKGYHTALDVIVCDTNLAIKRAEERTKKINRYVPESLILERAKNFTTYMNSYQKFASKISFFDGGNNFRPLKKI